MGGRVSAPIHLSRAVWILGASVWLACFELCGPGSHGAKREKEGAGQVRGRTEVEARSEVRGLPGPNDAAARHGPAAVGALAGA